MNKYIQSLVLIIIAITLYFNTINNEFIMDDVPHIKNNQTISDLSSFYSSTRWVGMHTFKINYYFNKLNVVGYHIINILIHIVNSFLILSLINLIINTSNTLKKFNPHHQYFAFLVALFFISHPIQTQAVTYIIQRLASLACMFYLLVLISYLKARESVSYTKYIYIFFFLLFLISGLFTKEIMYTVPLMILIIEILFFKNIIQYKKSIFKNWGPIFFITLIIIGVFTFFYNLDGIFLEQYSKKSGVFISPYKYLITQIHVVFLYLRLLILPVNQMFDYLYPISHSFFTIKPIISMFGLVLIASITKYLYFKKYKIEVFGILWFFVTLSIESTIIPLADIVFEHRLYLPSIGFFILLSSLLLRLHNKYASKIIICLILVLLLGYSIATYKRNLIWNTQISLWSDNIIKSPKNPIPYLARGKEYFRIGKYNNAIDDFTSALKLNPNLVQIIAERGTAYDRNNMYEQAISDYSQMVNLNERESDKWFRKIAILYSKKMDYNESLIYWNKAIKVKPCYYKYYISRGINYRDLGFQDKAIDDFKKAVFLDEKSLDEITKYVGINLLNNQFFSINKDLQFCKSN